MNPPSLPRNAGRKIRHAPARWIVRAAAVTVLIAAQGALSGCLLLAAGAAGAGAGYVAAHETTDPAPPSSSAKNDSTK